MLIFDNLMHAIVAVSQSGCLDQGSRRGAQNRSHNKPVLLLFSCKLLI
jgi:hypothetical protein